MRLVERVFRAGWGGGQAALVGVMCGLMGFPAAVLGQQVSGGKLSGEKHLKPLTERERVLQALNRFTFGSRPGDVAAVERLGLQRWFERELHPDEIDDSAFGAEMGQFPAMGLAVEQLRARFPSGAMIRQGGKQGGFVPVDPVERAIYADASYAEGERLRAAGTETPVTDEAPGITAGQVEAVLRLTPGDRFGRVVGMSPDEMFGFRQVVKGKDRVRLMEGMAPAQKEAVVAMLEAPERVVATEDQEIRLLRDIDSKRQLQAVMTEFWLNHFNVFLHKSEEEPYLLPAYEQDTVVPHALGRFEDLLVATAESPAMLMYLDNWQSIGPGSSFADGGRLRVAGPCADGGRLRAQPGTPCGSGVAAAGAQGQQGVVAGQAIRVKVPKGINENYGRELMELHTLGVGGGYSQQDVIEVAKCFTGWTIVRPKAGGGGKGLAGQGMGMASGVGAGMMGGMGMPGEFVFDPKRHEPGSKVVLGHVIPEGGMNEGLEVLHILATSPATAHFISQELAVRFVSDNPPPALVKRMAATYLRKDGDIGAVLETMFGSKEFWSRGVYRAKVKTPVEFLASAVRASGATVTNPLPLVQAMDRLGMPVWGMQTPNGYGWTAGDWVSSNGLLSRMNFALVLSGNRVSGTVRDWAEVLGGNAEASAETERALEGDLLGEAASARTRAAVMAEFANPTAQAQAGAGFGGRPVAGGGMVRAAVVKPALGKPGEVPLDTMAGLLMGSPEFQRR